MTRVDQKIGADEMNLAVQAALDDPRPGDTFHEMYSYVVKVVKVTAESVTWRSSTDQRGEDSREAWSKAFRYGDHLPGRHHMYLLERGELAHSLLDRLHEAHCCDQTNGVAHGYAQMDAVARQWIAEKLDDPAFRERVATAVHARHNPIADTVAEFRRQLGVTS